MRRASYNLVWWLLVVAVVVVNLRVLEQTGLPTAEGLWAPRLALFGLIYGLGLAWMGLVQVGHAVQAVWQRMLRPELRHFSVQHALHGKIARDR
jgi:hypothetical protein